MPTSRGLTLIEFIVLLVIVAVLAAIVGPPFMDADRLPPESDVRSQLQIV
ncbi:MAG: type II secretion system protein, partial [Planctomycetota bacterium]